jgi:uncharacterized protein (DUF1501 family)
MTSADMLKRRAFLRKACGYSFGLSAFNALHDLRLIQSAIAQMPGPGTFPDYKAIICLFLNGGNDANNMLVPNSTTEYAAYQASRGVLALSNTPGGIGSNSLLPLSTANTGGREFGIHANCPELQTLFNNGKLAFVTNAGTLVEPLNKTTYNNRTGRRPPQLFSHNDQVVQWMTSIPDQISPTGWGGRSADLLRSNVGSSNVSMSISTNGFNTFEVGKYVNQYQVPTAALGTPVGGAYAAALSGYTTGSARANAIRSLIAQGKTSATLNEKDYSQVFDTALNAADELNGALSGISTADHTLINTLFDGDTTNPGPLRNPNATPDIAEVRSLAGQMKMIARMIAARNTIGIKRQIFFCQLGGWDTHGSQFSPHGNLLRSVSRNVKALYDMLEALGIANQVTLFTASDFGRTYQTNGLGSDHGWGTHTMVVGGAVQGGRMYGQFPELVIGGSSDVTRGSWIPTTSVDEYAATIARWFGVTESNLDVVFPNLYRFSNRNLGFLA